VTVVSRIVPAACAILVAAAQLSLAETQPSLRTTVGIVESAAQEEDGTLWFEFDRIDQRFVIDARKVPDADAIFDLLKDSNTTHSSISVHFYVDGATIPPATTKPRYFVHDLTYGDKTIQIIQPPPQPDPNAVPLPRDRAVASLAKGLALAGDSDPGEALKALSTAIADESLEPSLHALALKTRADIYDEHATALWPPGADRDKMLFAALTDAQAWQAAAPDDPHAASAVAGGLAALGAYDEALAAYRHIPERWPDEFFWSEIRIAAIYRTLGDYDKALAVYDEMNKREGPETGMAYHYHRGWTLRKAGRLDEAIAEFTLGLKDQPDYGGAFFQRACALAQVGRLKEAQADEALYIKSFAAYGNDTPPTREVEHDLRRAAEVEKELQAAYERNPNEKLDAPCVGYWDWDEEKRTRSALLPAAAATAPPPSGGQSK
jgi:tetratricopeptide (TPR) repeat protein